MYVNRLFPSCIRIIAPAELAPTFVPRVNKLGFHTKALWTPDIAHTVQVAADLDIPFAASCPDEVLLRKEVQLVVITACPMISSQLSIKALGIGKHVICDVPSCLSLKEAVRMLSAAQYYPQLVALVGFGMRHLAVIQKTHQLLRQVAIGELLVIDAIVRTGALHGSAYNWRFEQLSGGGLLNIVGSHVIDLICFLVGKRAVCVQGVVQSLPSCSLQSSSSSSSSSSSCSQRQEEFRRMNADNVCSFLMRFDDGMHASVNLNALGAPNFFLELLCWGTQGQLIVQNFYLYLVKFTSNGPIKQLLLNEEADAPIDESFAGYANRSCAQLHQLTLFSLLRSLNKPLQARLSPSSSSSSETDRKSTVSAKEHTLNEAANFEDALYVKAVVEAIKLASLRGEDVHIEMPVQCDDGL
ncbi:glucose fructose oxidoreductase [Trichuris trichiura]|uniref:Glucose fructose oxidoreductase n=1 Tax=Trichuris trichiura TaxID=36087 RepID=A0A077ZG46_TRITR|nr:glucose fructose oxidoreductase [Trichuris trichiura]